MLMNFCHSSLKPLIKTDKVSFDDYEVSNLISGDPTLRRRGFISDHFIKPPVNITLQFPCNIAIYRIIIDPVIGQQKSCDMKIFTATQPMCNSWLYGKNENQVRTDGVIFNFVGTVSQTDPMVVCFENPLFRNKGCNLMDKRSYPCVVNVNSRKPGGLTNVSHITVCVQRTKGGKAVAIRSIEVWGTASSKVPYKLQQLLRKTYFESQQQECQLSKDSNHARPSPKQLSRIDSEVKKSVENVVQDGVVIPEDFLDQITYDIMTIPVILPSGKNIDQSSLEKFINTEASWGRPPSDPFTGLIFTPSSHPGTNAALKARIDKFVLSHSSALKTIPRTLGHGDNKTSDRTNNMMKTSRLLSSSNLTPDANSNCNLNVLSTTIDESTVRVSGNLNMPSTEIEFSFDSLNSGNNFFMEQVGQSNSCKFKTPLKSRITFTGKRKYDTCFTDSLVKETTKVPRIYDQITSKASPPCPTWISADSVKIESAITQVVPKKSHKTDLSRSLDSALSSALVGLPSFSRKSPTLALSLATSGGKIEQDENVCFKCGTILQKMDTVKYRLPCEHLICRKCLQSMPSQIECDTCNRICKSNEIVRIF